MQMGLGKTAQAIALLDCLRCVGGIHGPFIVVAPLTTLQHWLRELRAWTTLVGGQGIDDLIQSCPNTAGTIHLVLFFLFQTSLMVGGCFIAVSLLCYLVYLVPFESLRVFQCPHVGLQRLGVFQTRTRKTGCNLG